jgi:hypothetical protein
MTSVQAHPEKITQLQCLQCNFGLQAQFLQWAS